MRGRATGNTDTQDSPRLGLGEVTTFPLIVYSVTLHGACIQMAFLSRDSRVGVPKSRHQGLSGLWGRITSSADLRWRCGLKQSCSPCRELSNDMWHVAWSQVNLVDSRVLMVGSQIANLTPGLSLPITCFVDVQMAHARPFWTSTLQELSNDIENSSRQGGLTPAIALWRFGSPFGTPTPNMGVHLGVWRFIPSHSLHSRKLWNAPGSLTGPVTLQPLALVASPRLGLRQVYHMCSSYAMFQSPPPPIILLRM